MEKLVKKTIRKRTGKNYTILQKKFRKGQLGTHFLYKNF